MAVGDPMVGVAVTVGVLVGRIGVGLGAGQVNLLVGGFTALGTPTTVALGGLGSPSSLTWGTTGFAPAALVLNDIMANANLTLVLMPEAHAGDVVYLRGVWIEYKKKLLTS